MEIIINFLNENSNIIQIVLAFLSLIASIVVAFLIYWLQTKHENEIKEFEERRRKDGIKTEAKRFLIDYDDERDYLPLCIIANNVSLHKQHHREIYTSFNHCNTEVQEEILKQAKFPILKFENSMWVDDYLKQVKKFSEDNNLGKSPLYDSFKYFHRALKCYSNKKVSEFDMDIFILPNSPKDRLFSETKGDLSSYIYEYLERQKFYIGEDKNQSLLPPYDLMWDQLDLYNCPEYKMCFWTVESVMATLLFIAYSSDIAPNFYSKWKNQLKTDVNIETFEDFYYQALLELYMVYTSNDKGNLLD